VAIQDVVEAIQDTIGAVIGYTKTHDYPPDQINTSIASVVRLGPGGTRETVMSGEYRGLHNLIIELYTPYVDLANDIKRLMAYADSVPNALLADTTIDGSCDTFGRIVDNGVEVTN